MAIYPVKHMKTGETKVIEMSVHDIMQWYNDNPEWQRDWAQGCAGPADVGDWKNKLINKHPDWKQVLQKVERSPGSRAKDLY